MYMYTFAEEAKEGPSSIYHIFYQSGFVQFLIIKKQENKRTGNVIQK